MVESKPHSPTAHASVSNTKVDSLEPALDHPSSSLLFAEAGWHPTECYEIIKVLDMFGSDFYYNLDLIEE